jgi:hypothetical protein
MVYNIDYDGLSNKPPRRQVRQVRGREELSKLV